MAYYRVFQDADSGTDCGILFMGDCMFEHAKAEVVAAACVFLEAALIFTEIDCLDDDSRARRCNRTMDMV